MHVNSPLRDARIGGCARSVRYQYSFVTALILLLCFRLGSCSLEASLDSQVANVRSPKAFQDAAREGVQHVVITEHLDMSGTLTERDLPTLQGFDRALLRVKKSTQSIVVRELSPVVRSRLSDATRTRRHAHMQIVASCQCLVGRSRAAFCSCIAAVRWDSSADRACRLPYNRPCRPQRRYVAVVCVRNAAKGFLQESPHNHACTDFRHTVEIVLRTHAHGHECLCPAVNTCHSRSSWSPYSIAIINDLSFKHI